MKCRWAGPLGEVTNRNFVKRRWNWPFSLYAPRHFLYVPRHFGAHFEALLGVQNVPVCACWKYCPVYFPTQEEFLNLVLICPYKSSFSQHCFWCIKIGAEMSFFERFWPLGDSNHAQISCPSTSSCDFTCWIQKYKPFVIWISQSYGSRQWHDAQGEKTCVVTKNLSCDQNFPKFLEIWVGGSLWSDMLGQRGFSQYLKSIELPLPLFLLDCLPQFRLQIPDSGLAHFVSRHVVESHVSQ